MYKCTCCGKELPRGTGLIYVKKDAKIWYFCSTKCQKNILKLGRKPRTVKWTEESRKVRGKEVAK